MKKIILLTLLLCFCCPISTFGASPMVERHIFSPEPDGKGAFKSPMALKLEKELMFTGVIISSQGKWVIIREKGKKKDAETRSLHKLGDEIKGMVIKEIGRNFLILAGEEKEVRLNLYYEGKSRPAIPAESVTSSVPSEKSVKASPAASPEYRSPATRTKSATPFTRPSGSPARKPERKSSGFPPTAGPFPQGGTSPNPFQQQTSSDTPLQQAPPGSFPQEAPNPFLDENPNPFLQETPPNPFLQETPPTSYPE